MYIQTSNKIVQRTTEVRDLDLNKSSAKLPGLKHTE